MSRSYQYFRFSNMLTSERKRKRRILPGGSLTVKEGEELVQTIQTQQQEGSDTIQPRFLEGKRRHCGVCNTVGHNARTCKQSQDSITVE